MSKEQKKVIESLKVGDYETMGFAEIDSGSTKRWTPWCQYKRTMLKALRPLVADAKKRKDPLMMAKAFAQSVDVLINALREPVGKDEGVSESICRAALGAVLVVGKAAAKNTSIRKAPIMKKLEALQKEMERRTSYGPSGQFYVVVSVTVGKGMGGSTSYALEKAIRAVANDIQCRFKMSWLEKQS